MLSAASLTAQTCLHTLLQATGTRVVVAESPLWRALGVHRFTGPRDLAFAILPDALLLGTTAGILLVLRRVCAHASTTRLRHTVGQVVAPKPWVLNTKL